MKKAIERYRDLILYPITLLARSGIREIFFFVSNVTLPVTGRPPGVSGGRLTPASPTWVETDRSCI